MLELAAYCGHEAAALALCDRRIASEENPILEHNRGRIIPIGVMLRDMLIFEREAGMRGALVLAALVLEYFERAYPTNNQVRRAIQSGLDFVACVCDHHRTEALLACRGLKKLVSDIQETCGRESDHVVLVGAYHAVCAAEAVLIAAINCDDDRADEWIFNTAKFVVANAAIGVEPQTMSDRSFLRQAVINALMDGITFMLRI